MSDSDKIVNSANRLSECDGFPGYPETLFPLAPMTIVVGHYGVGKTNLSLNLAYDAKKLGQDPTLADLDIVNPYFRTSDHCLALEQAGIEIVKPTFAGSTLDVPSLPATLYGAIERADKHRCLLIDAGGDEVGATALGRFADSIKQKPYVMYYVVNACRNLTMQPAEAIFLARSIEERCGLSISGVIDNTNLGIETTQATLNNAKGFAVDVAKELNVALVATTVPRNLVCAPKSSVGFPNDHSENLYVVQRYNRTPWE